MPSGAFPIDLVGGLNPVELLICKREPHYSPSNGERRSRDASRRVISPRNRPQRAQRTTTRSWVRVPSLAPRGCFLAAPFSICSSIGKGPISSSIEKPLGKAILWKSKRFIFVLQRKTRQFGACLALIVHFYTAFFGALTVGLQPRAAHRSRFRLYWNVRFC